MSLVPLCLGMMSVVTAKTESLADSEPARMPHDSTPRRVLAAAKRRKSSMSDTEMWTSRSAARRTYSFIVDAGGAWAGGAGTSCCCCWGRGGGGQVAQVAPLGALAGSTPMTCGRRGGG